MRRTLTQANLTNADLDSTSLTNANLSQANLTNANLSFATLTNANLSDADVRGAQSLTLTVAITTNLIQVDGKFNGLDLNAGQALWVRDYDGDPTRSLAPIAISVQQHLALSGGGSLRMIFETDAWDSTISFAPGIPVALGGGTLELTFADGVDLASQIGRTFDLFDWTGVASTGAFAVSSPYSWNLSRLYTTGEITLNDVPEPSSVALALCSIVAVFLNHALQVARRRRKRLTENSQRNLVCTTSASRHRAARIAVIQRLPVGRSPTLCPIGEGRF